MKKFLVASFLSCFLCGGVAAAQTKTTDPAKRAQAKEKFLGAEKEYKVGHFGNALEGYYESFVLSGEPLLLYNVGQCYRNLGRYREALETYKEFLARAPETPFTPKAEKWISELLPKVGALEPTAPPTPASQPEPLTQTTSAQSAPASAPLRELAAPDAGSLQKDQLRLDLSEEEKGLKKARRFYKIGGAWVGGGLVLGGAMLLSLNDTNEAQATPGTSLAEIKRLRRQTILIGALADASVVVGGIYIQRAFSIGLQEKTARIEFASASGGGELNVSLVW